ncbi:polyprenyl synthetase family protein [Nocardioides bruguierae]|uniref:Polyprenyl synthetase family protein n=1 Tax=Nocardioides bruguierae TaxID=2945102 RepID=A0A9X2IHC3_9ACTN|nr:polyprenyl synthetase family protein [Nocardioides bruguierae]MCM0621640.1 polyprenyl synthetase family protein [Nocardioides bruguierae]
MTPDASPDVPIPEQADARPWDAAAFRARVQSALEQFLDTQAERLAPLGPDADRLVAEARAVVSGGKRFRAAFCWWGHQAVAGAFAEGEKEGQADAAHEDALVRASAALELLHASALVHDDLMDASDTRRGRPATHRGFEAEHRADAWRGDPEQYGAAAAILLGDLLLSWSDELLRTCGLPTERVAAALAVLDACRTEVIAGQFLDVSVQARGRADVDAAMTVLRYKSAKYSIERPLHVGAALAGADEAQVRALTGFGLPLGEAFQLRDDLLGVYGDPATTGKPAGDDLVEGKRTVLVALALDAASEEDAALLDRSLGRPLTDEQVDRLRAVITEAGAAAQVEEVITALADRAVGVLRSSGFDPRAIAVLTQLASAATQRAL